jgi:type IV secretory pathway VirJ component
MKKILSLLFLAAACAALFYLHAGYYNGQVYRDLPATPADAATPAIVILSGDMGDRVGMAPKIAARLHGRGYTVVTVNSLTYFSPRRTPAEVAAMIDAAMTRAMRLGRTDRVVLIGQSFGADMLHAGLAEFSPARRRPIQSVVLVVPGEDVVFRASPIELAGLERPDRPAFPSASQLTWVPVTCIRGADERDSLCPKLTMANVRKIVLPGGHMLDFDDRALEAAILPAVQHASAIAGSE